MSMMEQLQASMNRRQAAISGKKDRMEQKRESTLVKGQSSNDIRQSLRESLEKAPPSTILDGDSDSDSSASSGRGRAFSDDSPGPTFAAKKAAPPPAAASPKPKTAPPPSAKPAAAPGGVVKINAPEKTQARAMSPKREDEQPKSRSGSLWDNEGVSKLLNSGSAKKADDDGSGSDDGDWD